MTKKKRASSDTGHGWVSVNLTFFTLEGPIGCRTLQVSGREYAKLVAASRPMSMDEVSAAIEDATKLIEKMEDSTVPVTHWLVTPYCWPADEEQPAA